MANNEREKPAFGVPGLGAFEKIRAGPGVVGRTTALAIAFTALSGLAIYTVRDDRTLVAVFFGVAAAICTGVVWRAFSYAERHPDHAVLDGAELVRYREVELAAKDPTIIDLSATPVTNDAAPKAISSTRDRDV